MSLCCNDVVLHLQKICPVLGQLAWQGRDTWQGQLAEREHLAGQEQRTGSGQREGQAQLRGQGRGIRLPQVAGGIPQVAMGFCKSQGDSQLDSASRFVASTFRCIRGDRFRFLAVSVETDIGAG